MQNKTIPLNSAFIELYITNLLNNREKLKDVEEENPNKKITELLDLVENTIEDFRRYKAKNLSWEIISPHVKRCRELGLLEKNYKYH